MLNTRQKMINAANRTEVQSTAAAAAFFLFSFFFFISYVFCASSDSSKEKIFITVNWNRSIRVVYNYRQIAHSIQLSDSEYDCGQLWTGCKAYAPVFFFSLLSHCVDHRFFFYWTKCSVNNFTMRASTDQMDQHYLWPMNAIKWNIIIK